MVTRPSRDRLELWARDQLWVAPLVYAAGAYALAVGLADAGWGAFYLRNGDNVLLAHQDRARILGNGHRKLIIGTNGDVAQTFLVDGFVAGTWKVDKGRVVATPFAPLSAAAKRELRDEAERLEAFLG